MFGSMVFAGVVGLVEDALLPQVFELTLGIMALQPVKTLIFGFLGFGCHGFHGEALCGDVVGGDRGWIGLIVPQFFESDV
jgi:hypothetical protein